MFKKYRNPFSIAALFITTSAVQPTAIASNQFIYVGMAPTYSSTQFDWQNADTASDTNPGNNGQAIINNTNGNTQIGAFIGYGVLIDQIYIGIEGGTQFGSRTATSSTRDFNNQIPLTNTVSMSDIYLIDFRPGYVLPDKNSMLYGILGLNTANFTAEQETTTSPETVVLDSGPMRTNGLRLGVGYNLGLGRHFMARVEYIFTKFSSIQFSDTYPDGSQTHTWELNPYSNEVNIGLSAIFNL